LLAVVRHRERLGVALRFVVDASGADRIDMTPIRLGLRVDLRIAVDLARGRQQEPGAFELGEPEHVVGPVRAHLERVQGQALIVDGAGRTRQVEDEVYGLLEKERLRDVVMNEPKVRAVLDVPDVLQRPCVEVVDTDDPTSFGKKEVT
jgi:hypothetical protein